MYFTAAWLSTHAYYENYIEQYVSLARTFIDDWILLLSRFNNLRQVSREWIGLLKRESKLNNTKEEHEYNEQQLWKSRLNPEAEIYLTFSVVLEIYRLLSSDFVRLPLPE